MARIAPFPFKNDGTDAEIKPNRFVDVDLAAGTCKYAVDDDTLDGVTYMNTSAEADELISVYPKQTIDQTFLVECGGTVDAGDDIGSDTEGRAIVTVGTPAFTALEAGVVGQYINVISKAAF